MSAVEYVCTFANGRLVPMSELVRCRKCKHFEPGGMCLGWQTQPDGFCAWGVRREDA